jgi:uncharacterized membrane protein YhaH (DUF805 family)
MFILICTIMNIILALIGLDLISLIMSFLLLIPNISLAARRLHDTGRGGWWQIIILIPVIGFIILIVLLALDGHEANDYGVNPKSVMPA